MYTESTQFACSLVQMVPFPRHLRKFRGAACYSAAGGKPWALLITLEIWYLDPDIMLLGLEIPLMIFWSIQDTKWPPYLRWLLFSLLKFVVHYKYTFY